MAWLIDGEADVDTLPEHSRRALAALAGPKRLILGPGARHNEAWNRDVWAEVEQWLDAVLARTASGRPPVGTHLWSVPDVMITDRDPDLVRPGL
jgi:hypothetical protein